MHQILLMFVACFVALFPVIDPVGSGLIVNGYYGNIGYQERKEYTRKILINCLVIATVSLLLGHLILLIFGLAVPVIQIAGGFVICKSGLEWLSNNDESNTEGTIQEGQNIKKSNIESKLFYPVSFPICMGPGTISVIFTLMATAEVNGNYLMTGINYGIILVTIVLQLLMLYFVIMGGSRINQKIGPAGTLIINKLIAFITFCIGIQILVTGIAKTFHLTIL